MSGFRRLALIVALALTATTTSADEPPPPAPPPAAEAQPATDAPAPPPVIVVPGGVPFVGHVLRKGDRVPMTGVHVILDTDVEHEAITDDVGAFAFAAVAPGEHAVHLRGTDLTTPVDLKETLHANKKLDVTYFVAIKFRYSTTVRGAAVVRETVEQTLTTEEIKHIPGTQGDTLKAVQNLPGVARSAFGGGQLVVWGSSPQDTRTYVDGVYIPTLYHFGGLRSTVNGEMVDKLSFLPGGYGVDYGRGLGGVVEVETRKPRADGYHGFVQIDLIDGSLMLEGPITKDLSFAIAGRRSWIDVFLPLLTTNAVQISPRYYDYQAALHWRPTPRDDVDLFIFGSDDTISLDIVRPDPSLSAAFDTHTYYHRLITSWRHRFWKRSVLNVAASIGYDTPFQFKATFGQTTLDVGASTFEYTLRASARMPLSNWLRVDAGIDFEGNAWSLSADVPASGMPREGDTGFGGGGGFLSDATTLYTEQTAPFVTLVINLLNKKLTISPALRVELITASAYHGTPYEFSSTWLKPEPRLTARYQLTTWLDLKGAMGVYHQLPDPGSFMRLFGNTAVQPQTGWHYVLGFDARPTSTLDIQLEGFYKDLRELVVRGETASDPLLVNEGVGRVYGAEVIIRQQLWHGFYGWIAYTLSRSERKDHPDSDWRLFQYDQTHILTLIASYKFGRGYQIGARYRYVTGSPSTPVLGAYADLNGGFQAYVPIYGPTYSSRLPSFQQLDIRFDKVWTYNRFRFAFYLDIQNLTNASNAEGFQYSFDYKQSAPVSGLPFLPVFGFRGDF